MPGTLAVASNWVALNAVPWTMAAGLVQVIVGVAGATLIVAVAVAVE